MRQQDENRHNDYPRKAECMISRRLAVGSSALAVLGLLSRSAFGQTGGKTSQTRGGDPNASASRRGRQQSDDTLALFEKMRGTSPEERAKIMTEMSAASRQRAMESLKNQLGASDKEWAVIKPRLEAVYDLVHPVQQAQLSAAQAATDLEQKSRDLRELLKDEKAPTEQVKVKLAALRAAKDKSNQDLARARKSLLEILTLRQEALLVLNGLLD
jgi:hypothetical protein